MLQKTISFVKPNLIKPFLSDLYTTYHAIFDHAPNCIKILTKDGQLLKMNRAGLDLIDAESIDQVYMHKVEQLVHPDDVAIFRTAHLKAVSGHKVEAEFRIHTLKGETRYMHSVLSPMRSNVNGEIDAVLSITRDITQERINLNLFDEVDQQFTSLFNYHPDAIITTDTNGNIKRLNPAACILLDATEQDLMNRNYQDFLVVDREKGTEHFEKAIYGESQEYEIFIVTHKGNERLVSITLIPYKLAGTTVGITAVAKDITEIRTAEEEVKLKSYLLDKIQQAVILCDSNGSVTYWNEYSSALFGWTKEEVYGKNVLEILPIANNKEHAAQIFNDLLSNKNWDGNFIVRKKDNSSFTAKVSASPFYGKSGDIIGLIGLVSDVSDELKNREAVDFQAYLLNNVQQSVIATNLNGNIIYWNNYATKLFGFSRQEMLGKTMNDFGLHIAANKQLNTKITNNLAKGLSWSGEYKVNNKKGNELHLFAIISPLYHQDVRTGMLAVSFDISDKKIVEQERDKLIAELTQRNQDLKEYGYTVSHSIRAPIANLAGLLSLLEKSKLYDKDALDVIEGIEVSTKRLANVLNDLIETLSVKERTNIEKEKLTFLETFNEVQSSLRALINEQAVKLTVNFDKAPEVLYHKPYLESLLYNLITNSIKFKQRDKNPHIEITSVKEGDKTILVYKDNGLGFDLGKFKHKVFGLHQRFHHHAQGRGLGLYLIKTQLRVLGGKIELKSIPNQGSTFKITF